VFAGARLAVFVDGDFWHGNNWIARKQRLVRGHNSQYWIAKIEANIARDAKRSEQLRIGGWKVIRVWESDIVGDLPRVIRRVERAMRSMTSPTERGRRKHSRTEGR
jgi:G:T-mismatch repair DNA endonuclease (very short patch repair protein)